MTALTDHDAFAHTAYDAAVRRAAARAFNEKACFSVYYDGQAIFVRDSAEPPPDNAKLICIAQRWDDKQVQLRFDGARSEWISLG